MSAPAASQTSATALANEIFSARNELAACLISSALAMSVNRKGVLDRKPVRKASNEKGATPRASRRARHRLLLRLVE